MSITPITERERQLTDSLRTLQDIYDVRHHAFLALESKCSEKDLLIADLEQKVTSKQEPVANQITSGGDIPPWTDEDKKRLSVALEQVKTPRQEPVAIVEAEEPDEPASWRRAKLNSAGLKLSNGTHLYASQQPCPKCPQLEIDAEYYRKQAEELQAKWAELEALSLHNSAICDEWANACKELGLLNLALAKWIKEIVDQPDRHALQNDGKHPAPCARHCEAPAFAIEERRLKARITEISAQNSLLRSLLPRELPDNFIGFGKYYMEHVTNFAPPHDVMSKYKRSWFDDCAKALSAPVCAKS